MITKNDPKEIKNLASIKSEIVMEMESILMKNLKNAPIIKEEIIDKRKAQAMKSLKEMGYD